MFDILFGWRKASKCKKLIRKVQCRLKLLKNKRRAIVRQLRDDVAELLKLGHNQSAFDRVEQVIKDENLVAVYELLENFCEFTVINLPYIRRSKDCPNDINEAVSSLIFASARFGDLPELRLIRKLFGERYGQRFEAVALQLLPGNLVNRQLHEKLCTTSIPDEVKSKVMVEIAGSALKSGPLLLEYSSEFQQLENKGRDDPVLSVETSNEGDEDHSPHAPNIWDAEKVIVYVDLSSENMKFLKDLCLSFMSPMTIFPFTVHQSSTSAVDSSVVKKEGLLLTSAPKINPSGFPISGLEQIERDDDERALVLAHDEGTGVVKSSSESSGELPEEIMYLDDIQELESPVRKGGSSLDQRLFMFKSSVVPMTGKIDNVNDRGLEEQRYTGYRNAASSRSFRKSKNVSSKRPRRRSVSIDITSTRDVECAIYYGESCDDSRYYDQVYHDRRKHHKKIPIKQHRKSYFTQETTDFPRLIRVRSSFSFVSCSDKQRRSSSRCSSNNRIMNNYSLENPCYFCISDEKNNWNSSPRMPKVECRPFRHQCFCNMEQDNQHLRGISLHKPSKKCKENASSSPLFISSHSRVSSPSTSKANKPSYSRTTTMPIERPNDDVNDGCPRSNSFPVEQRGRCSSNRHVHPKLPDYDELAAKLTALKRAKMLSKKQQMRECE